MKPGCSLAWWLAVLQCLWSGVPVQLCDRAPARAQAVWPSLGRHERRRLTEQLNKAWAGPAQRRARLLRPRLRASRGRRHVRQGQAPKNLPTWRGWPLRGQRIGEAQHPGPAAKETEHEVVIRKDFWTGLLDAAPQATPKESRPKFSQVEWEAAAKKTYPQTLTALLNGKPVLLPKKLAAPWRSFQQLDVGRRLDKGPKDRTSNKQLAATAAAGIYCFPEHNAGQDKQLRHDLDTWDGGSFSPSPEEVQRCEQDSFEEDLMSEVNYDPSTEEEEECVPGCAEESSADLQAWHFQASTTLTTPASNKRRRLWKKTPPPRVVPEGYQAILPEKLPDSIWAREAKVSVYTVDFKTAKNKPLSLQPLQIPELPCTHPELFCITGKEQGQCYYAAKPLWHSATARAVLQACEDVQTAYKRLPLLLSPSTWKTAAGILADKANDIWCGDTPVTDGQSECSPAAAKRIGLLPPDAGPDKPCLYSPLQIRGVLPLSALECCLCKGMLVVDVYLQKGIRLRKECRKVHWNRSDPNIEHGFAVTQTTEAAMKPATINSQAAAALMMRACSLPTAVERRVAIAALSSLVKQLQEDTVEQLKSVAWGLPDGTRKARKGVARVLHDSPPSRAAAGLASQDADKEVIERVPQHLLRVRLCEDDTEEPAESDRNLVTKTVAEAQHTHISKGTKRALLGGGGAFNGALTQQRNDPHLTLAGGAWVLFALADCTGDLEDRQCWIISEGRSIVGPVVVWRVPVAGPSDFQIWEARPWPRDLWARPNNCCVCSTKGLGITALGGGDYDGDTIFVTANRGLLNFIDQTEEAVRNLPHAEAAGIKEVIEKEPRTAWSAKNLLQRASEYVRHVLRVPTLNVRGTATRYSELVQDGFSQAAVFPKI
ncbi:unnamed protein product [Symbiodinium sp. CCMP2592]|nr:unnamed protein product [Symbiodinium sp. CCMP2592]